MTLEKPFGRHLAFRRVQTRYGGISQQEGRTSPAPRKDEGFEEETPTHVATERVRTILASAYTRPDTPFLVNSTTAPKL